MSAVGTRVYFRYTPNECLTRKEHIILYDQQERLSDAERIVARKQKGSQSINQGDQNQGSALGDWWPRTGLEDVAWLEERKPPMSQKLAKRIPLAAQT